MDTPRELLLQMLAEQSFHLGEFKLSSGGSSDYYIDCRATTLSGEGARHVGRVFYEEIYNSGTQPESLPLHPASDHQTHPTRNHYRTDDGRNLFIVPDINTDGRSARANAFLIIV